MKNDIIAVEEALELAKENYNTIKEGFIKDAEVNYEVYQQDLNYLVAIDILKASDYMLNCFTRVLNTVLDTQNDSLHLKLDKVVEMTIKTNKKIDKELRPYFKLEPKRLKNQVDELLKSLKDG